MVIWLYNQNQTNIWLYNENHGYIMKTWYLGQSPELLLSGVSDRLVVFFEFVEFIAGHHVF